jgi:hypothetical protein
MSYFGWTKIIVELKHIYDEIASRDIQLSVGVLLELTDIVVRTAQWILQL